MPLSRRGLGLVCAVVVGGVACAGLDPILAPDGGPEDATLDGIASSDASKDVTPADAISDASQILDAADAEVGAFTCGNKVCDSTLHYCEKKTADAGPPDASREGGVEVDTCIPYPINCADDGGKPGCACINEPCVCDQVGTDITVTCP